MNDAIRRGLAPGTRGDDRPAFRVEPHRTTLLSGIDPADFNRLADELEDDAVMAEVPRER